MFEAMLMEAGSKTDAQVLRKRSSMICVRATLRRLASSTIEPHWLVDRMSASHSACSNWVRSSAMALRKGTKTAELVEPMGAGGGRQERRLRIDPLRAAAAGGVDGTGKSADDHCTANGPDRDGTVIVAQPRIDLMGRICARSAKIWV